MASLNVRDLGVSNVSCNDGNGLLVFTLDSANSEMTLGALPPVVVVLAMASRAAWGGTFETTLGKSLSITIRANLSRQKL